MIHKAISFAVMAAAMATPATAPTNTTHIAANRHAPAWCTDSVVINAPASEVWQVLTSIDQWSLWQKDIPQARLQGALAPGATFTWKTGGATIHSRLHTVQPATAFGWTGKTFGARAIHNWYLTEKNGTTTVTVEESMSGTLVALFRKSFNKNLATGMHHWLQQLKTHVETQKGK